MESAVRHTYDALLALQAIGSEAITATAVGSQKITLYPLGVGAGPRPLGDVKGRFGIGNFDVVVHVAALDHTTGDETYTLEFCTYDVDGANETVQESVVVTLANVGEILEFAFHPDTLKKFDDDAAQFGVKAVLAGTTPSLTYWAFASESTH